MIFILGGAQTDFARNYSREGAGVFEMLGDAVRGALDATEVSPSDIEVAHVGNFTAELFAGQGHLGGMFAALDPAFAGLPTARHEAACASGSIAALAASAELEAGRYSLACVAGVEQMRNVDAQTAAKNLGAAAWAGREAQDARFLWPAMFSDIAEAYQRRKNVPYEELMRIARQAFDNAKKNPNAQTRSWKFEDAQFSEDAEANPVVEGCIRKQDCGRITDGAAAVLLANEAYASAWARRRGIDLASVPRIEGWGHRTAPLLLADRLASEGPYLFPELRSAVEDAWRRASIDSVEAVDVVELHDCFTVTHYAIVDHLGVAAGGPALNPSGGLIGAGHPVGATGVRMLLDAHKQVTGTAGDYQVDGVRRAQTVNIGGSFTTTVSFVVGRG